MRLYFVSIILLLFCTSIANAQQQPTIWGPGDQYTIAYLHSINVKNGSNLVLFEENLPVTEFEVFNFTNPSYKYIYRGYGDLIENGSVQIATKNGVDYPTGDFPITLPIRFGDNDEWIAYFTSQTNKVDKDPYHFFDSSLSESQGFVEFNSSFNLLHNYENGPLSNYQLMPNDILSKIKLNLSRIYLNMEYNTKTGVINKYNYSIYNPIYFISEQLDFVALIPPLKVDVATFPYYYLIAIPIIVLYRRKSV